MQMRVALWPGLGSLENEAECGRLSGRVKHDLYAIFVAAGSDNQPIGFIEASLREYADGCDSSPVGYIEGWYVMPRAQRQGIGRRLVAAAEEWARSRGCTEMASDSILENAGGQQAHERLGYVEVERQVIYRKDLV